MRPMGSTRGIGFNILSMFRILTKWQFFRSYNQIVFTFVILPCRRSTIIVFYEYVFTVARIKIRVQR